VARGRLAFFSQGRLRQVPVCGSVRRGASKAKVAAELRLPDGTVTATCQAVVVRPPQRSGSPLGTGTPLLES